MEIVEETKKLVYNIRAEFNFELLIEGH